MLPVETRQDNNSQVRRQTTTQAGYHDAAFTPSIMPHGITVGKSCGPY